MNGRWRDDDDLFFSFLSLYRTPFLMPLSFVPDPPLNSEKHPAFVREAALARRVPPS